MKQPTKAALRARLATAEGLVDTLRWKLRIADQVIEANQSRWWHRFAWWRK